LLATIREQSGQPIRWEAEFPERLTVDVEARWDVVLEAVVSAAGLQAYWADDTVVVCRAEPKGPGFFAPEQRPAPESPDPDPTGYSPPDPGLLIDLDVRDMPLGDVMASISSQTGAWIEVDPNVDVTVSERFVSINWRLAVDLVAKTYNCEVEELADGTIKVAQPNCGVNLAFENGSLRTVLQVLSQYMGLHLILTERVQGNLWVCARGDPIEMFQQIVRACELRAGERDGVVVVGGAKAWGQPFESLPDFEALPAPRMTTNLLQASAAPAATWLAGLAYKTNRSIVIRNVDSTISTRLVNVDYLEAMRRAAHDLELELRLAGDYVIVTGEPASEAEGDRAAAEPRGKVLDLPNGQQARIDLQGITQDIGPPEEGARFDQALVGGRVYRVGDALLNEHSDDLPIWVHEITADAVHFKVGDREADPVVVPLPKQ